MNVYAVVTESPVTRPDVVNGVTETTALSCNYLKGLVGAWGFEPPDPSRQPNCVPSSIS